MERRPSRHKPPVLKRIRTRERRYPIWSVRSVVAVGLVGFALTAGLVLLMGPGRLITRLEVTLAVVAGALFLFLSVGLHSGARVRKREDVAGELKTVGMPESVGETDVGSWFDIGAGADDLGCAGVILWLLALLLVPVVMVFLFVVVANVGLVLFFLVALTTGWLFQRALRQVFARSRRCRSDLAASLLYAGWYTLLYTGWLFAVLVLVDRLNKSRGA